jgi:hypothetical protein
MAMGSVPGKPEERDTVINAISINIRTKYGINFGIN